MRCSAQVSRRERVRACFCSDCSDDIGSLVGELTREIAADLGTYLYTTISTTMAFSLFGGVVGDSADRLAQLATTDGLTDLLNSRAFRQRFHEEMVRAVRYRQPLSLLIVDLDGLKRINDEYGHDAGDKALCRVAAAVRAGLREADLAARIGGDEFAVLAPNTNETAAIVLGERLRALVADGNPSGVELGTSVSIGIASFVPSHRDAVSERSLMRAADMALYRAKREGGNRAMGADETCWTGGPTPDGVPSARRQREGKRAICVKNAM
jgi:diguanylate cyclase (GGDEF)-like protein